jgi:hypothetical protein
LVLTRITYSQGRSAALLEIWDTTDKCSHSTHASPHWVIHLPVLQQGATILRVDTQTTQPTALHPNKPFATDTEAGVLAISVDAMAPSAEGTEPESFIIVVPVHRLGRLPKAYDKYGPALSWDNWGTMNACVVAVEHSYLRRPLGLSASWVHGFKLVHTCEKQLHVFDFNDTLVFPREESESVFVATRSATAPPVESWVFENVLHSKIGYQKQIIHLPEVAINGKAESASLTDEHIVVTAIVRNMLP